MTRLLASATLFFLATLPSAGADVACQPTTLGSQRCSGGPVRPEPRPVIRADTQALERVRDRHGQEAAPTTFVPAGRRSRLGTTIIDAPGPIGTCQADNLGNLRCR